MARDPDAQAVHDEESATTVLGAKPAPEEPKTGIAALIAKLTGSRPVRSFQHYTSEGGAIMAAGMSYQGLFALFAAIWVTFSVAGFIVADNPALRDLVFDGIDSAVPGLVGDGGDGAINPDDLLSTGALSWTGAIALVGLLFTALGFLASMRDAIRRIFDLPPDTTFFALQKAKDLGLAVGFGLLIVVSSVISFTTSAALEAIFALMGIDPKSVIPNILGRVVGYLVVFVVDTATLMVAYRVLSAIKIPFRRLLVGGAIAGAALGVLKVLFALGIIGGVGSNQLLAGFAVIIGLLIFLNFVCQALLVGAAWISVGMKDANIDPRSLSAEELEIERARQLEDARRLVAKTNLEKAQEEYRAARGLRRWRLARQIRQDARAEARRRAQVPTDEELREDPKLREKAPTQRERTKE